MWWVCIMTLIRACSLGHRQINNFPPGPAPLSGELRTVDAFHCHLRTKKLFHEPETYFAIYLFAALKCIKYKQKQIASNTMINSLVIKMHQSIIYLYLAPLWISLGALWVFCVKCKVGCKQGPDVTDGPVSPLEARAVGAESVCDFIRRGADKHSLAETRVSKVPAGVLTDGRTLIHHKIHHISFPALPLVKCLCVRPLIGRQRTNLWYIRISIYN